MPPCRSLLVANFKYGTGSQAGEFRVIPTLYNGQWQSFTSTRERGRAGLALPLPRCRSSRPTSRPTPPHHGAPMVVVGSVGRPYVRLRRAAHGGARRMHGLALRPRHVEQEGLLRDRRAGRDRLARGSILPDRHVFVGHGGRAVPLRPSDVPVVSLRPSDVPVVSLLCILSST